MHVLTTRGGELVGLFGPLFDEPGGPVGLAGLESAHLVETATVADRADVTLKGLETAATDFLQRTGWAAVDAALAAEVATAMAADVADIASDYPVGTRLHATFDLCTDEWTIVPESDVSA